jgi:acetoacetate decarboxylase
VEGDQPVLAGLFRASSPASLPPGLRPLLGARARVVTVVRYLPGSTLVYDELIVATPVLVGWRPGLYIDHIWVDSLASLWGGRRIWGLPKNLADFVWDDRGVTVADSSGRIMVLALDRSPARGPALPVATAGVGRLSDRWTWGVVPMRARFGGAGLRVVAMSPRFGFHLSARPFIAVASRECRVTFPSPMLLS